MMSDDESDPFDDDPNIMVSIISQEHKLYHIKTMRCLAKHGNLPGTSEEDLKGRDHPDYCFIVGPMNDTKYGLPRLYRLCDLEHVLHDMPDAEKFYNFHGTPQRKLKPYWKTQF